MRERCLLYPRKRTCAAHRRMSAMCQKRTLPALFDHLVGSNEQAGWHPKTERLRRFQVDRCFELCRRLYRKVGRFFTLENAIDVTRCAPMRVDRIESSGDQATGGDE